MPRTARIKSENSIYHIMAKCISEIVLFRDESDKDRYLRLIKKYQYCFGFKVYAYCLMDNHVHLIIDANGADISRIMHGINQSYAQGYNRKYLRSGHVFQDRFKSKIVNSDRYLIALSRYIHNNPKDIIKYANSIQSYRYSSFGIYLGSAIDRHGILDCSFILNYFGEHDDKSKQHYAYLMDTYSGEKDLVDIDLEFKNEGSEYRSHRVMLPKTLNKEEIIELLCKTNGIGKEFINIKYDRRFIESKAVYAALLRLLCNFKHRDICTTIGNITQSRVSALCSKGIDFVIKNNKYSMLTKELIKKKRVEV